VVDAIGAPHTGERPEKALISSFVDRIAELKPQLVTFNGSSFDLPVLRYRAMVHGVAAPGLSSRPYFNRYTEDAIDLCDVLSSFNHQGKATLHELCRVMGLPGKPDGMSGEEVEKYYRDGHIGEIAAYCESDVVNTYRLWLRYERFCGRLSEAEFDASETRPFAWSNTGPDIERQLSMLIFVGRFHSTYQTVPTCAPQLHLCFCLTAADPLMDVACRSVEGNPSRFSHCASSTTYCAQRSSAARISSRYLARL